nr:MAG TPA: hypothetical protein [Caudoviricetes sp.]
MIRLAVSFFKIATVVPLGAVPGSSPGTTIFKSYRKIKM